MSLCVCAVSFTVFIIHALRAIVKDFLKILYALRAKRKVPTQLCAVWALFLFGVRLSFV
nr:MAG TPA: hypothetical protein [Caudoviricetes sp.]